MRAVVCAPPAGIDGSYLVRPSKSNPGDFTLSVRCVAPVCKAVETQKRAHARVHQSGARQRAAGRRQGGGSALLPARHTRAAPTPRHCAPSCGACCSSFGAALARVPLRTGAESVGGGRCALSCLCAALGPRARRRSGTVTHIKIQNSGDYYDLYGTPRGVCLQCPAARREGEGAPTLAASPRRERGAASAGCASARERAALFCRAVRGSWPSGCLTSLPCPPCKFFRGALARWRKVCQPL